MGCSNRKTSGYISVPLDDNTGGSVIFYNDKAGQAPHKTELVQVDIVDNVLPADIVLDFALIDVERLEVECMEGMLETIRRSPNLVMMVEWMNISVNTNNIAERIKILLDELTTLRYKYYILDAPPGNCDPEKFREMSKEEV